MIYERIAKFRKRLGKLSTNQIVSELHKFGSVQYLKKISLASKSVLKRAQRKMINVQPTAVQRRTKENGSKKRVKWGGSSKLSSEIPVQHASRKRTHELSRNIDNNVLSAKKHSRDMKSRCRPTIKPRQITKK